MEFVVWIVYLYKPYVLTYSTVQSPSWEANRLAASQEIPCISWIPKVRYRTHKRQPPVPILGQPIPVHIPTSHLLEIHPNIIHPSLLRSPQWSLSLLFPNQDPIHPPLLTHMRHMLSPSHSSQFITHTILDEEYKSFSSSLCSLLHSPVTSSLLGPNILLNTMFSNTLSFLSSHNVSDQVSHPYERTGKIIVLYILIFNFLDSNLENKRFCTDTLQTVKRGKVNGTGQNFGRELLSKISHWKQERRNEKEDVSSYWMILRKREDTGILKGSTRSHPVEYSLWKWLWTCLKAEYVLNKRRNSWTTQHMWR